MKKLLLLLLLSVGFVGSVNAHSGRTDSSGGHNDYSNGTYHYHSNKYAPMTASTYYQAAGGGTPLGTLLNSGSSGSSNSGRRLLDFGTTWKKVGNLLRGSNGVVCPNFSSSRASCTNGVSYWMCGNMTCGSDGTYYWNEGSSCQRSSFGSYCCNDGYGTHSVTCR